MPKEIKSAATRDAGSVSNDEQLRRDYERGIPPEQEQLDSYERDLNKSNADSMHRVAQTVNREREKEQSGTEEHIHPSQTPDQTRGTPM